MKSPNRLLILEDDAIFAELLQIDLSKRWRACAFVVAHNEKQFTAALEEGGFDLIISDYVMPGFPGLAALAMARERCPDIPFLFVSGAIGDEVELESLKAG